MSARTSKGVEQAVLNRLTRGETTRQVADTTGLSISLIRTIAHRNGRSDLIRPHCPHPARSDAFSVLNSEVAYWLGFLFADGWVRPTANAVGVRLQAGDREHLERFVHFLGCPNRPIHMGWSTKRGRDHLNAVVTLCNRAIVSDLIHWGVIPNKSRVDCPTHSDLAKSGAFWRGFMDGDGCVSFDPFGAPRLTMYNSSCSLMSQYRTYAEGIIGHNPELKRNRKIYAVTLHGTRARDVLAAMEAATPAGVSLARKQRRVDRALQWRSEREVAAVRAVRIARSYKAGETVGAICPPGRCDVPARKKDRRAVRSGAAARPRLRIARAAA